MIWISLIRSGKCYPYHKLVRHCLCYVFKRQVPVLYVLTLSTGTANLHKRGHKAGAASLRSVGFMSFELAIFHFKYQAAYIR